MAFKSWSRNSRFVLTSSKDWNVIMWDMASDIDPPQRKTTIRFDASVSSASFHPRNRWALLYYVSSPPSPLFSQIILALLQSGDAYLVDLRKKHRGRVELEEVQYESDDEANASPRCVPPVTAAPLMQVNILTQVSHDSGSIRSYRSIYICRNFYRVYPRLQYEDKDR